MYATAWFCDGEAPSQAPPIPVPRVVERGADDTAAWLVTEAVPGVAAAEEWPEHQRFAVVEAMAELARALHELPVEDCPFDRRLDAAVAEARRNVAEGLWTSTTCRHASSGYPRGSDDKRSNMRIRGRIIRLTIGILIKAPDQDP